MSSPAPPVDGAPPGCAAGVGPGRLPVAVRAASGRTADSVVRCGDAHQVRTGRADRWTPAHRRWLTLGAVLVAAVAFAVLNHPAAWLIVVLVLVLPALPALIALLAAGGHLTAGARPGRAGSAGAR